MELEVARNLVTNDNMPIPIRMRALFCLRNIHSLESVNSIAEVFKSKSILLKHEAAYVVGQMRMKESIGILIKMLSDEEEDEIVRHEAGEALGNFWETDEIVCVLTKYSKHSKRSISETCYLALMKLKENRDGVSIFGSRDPAFPFEGAFEEACAILLNKSECLYRRYQAMFLLRDVGSEEAIHTLGKAMEDDSALFRHEISFVFGQMRSSVSVPYLIRGIENEFEHEMVRHECTEALGAIGGDIGFKVLVKYLHDPCDVLRESVEVAIDIHNHVTENEVEYCTLFCKS